MIPKEQVASWIREEGNELEDVEDPESHWRLGVEFPAGSGHWLDLIHAAERETLIAVSTNFTSESDLEILRSAARESQLTSFLEDLQLELLRLPMQYRIGYIEDSYPQLIESVDVAKYLYAGQINKANLYKAMEDVARGAYAATIHFQRLQRLVAEK